MLARFPLPEPTRTNPSLARGTRMILSGCDTASPRLSSECTIETAPGMKGKMKYNYTTGAGTKDAGTDGMGPTAPKQGNSDRKTFGKITLAVWATSFRASVFALRPSFWFRSFGLPISHKRTAATHPG
jgi:hypothetical protein